MVSNEHANIRPIDIAAHLFHKFVNAILVLTLDCIVITVRDITDGRGGLDNFLLEVCKASDEPHWQGE